MSIKILLLIVLFVTDFTSYAQVGIGTTNPKAALDISSTTSGVLVPRMDTAMRTGLTVAADQNGIMVYDTDTATFWYYEHGTTSWVEIKVGARKFVDGDTSTDATYTDGNVGIGTTSPSEKLEVNGTIKANSINLSTTAGVNAGGACTSLGQLVFNGTIFLGCDGSIWTQLN